MEGKGRGRVCESWNVLLPAFAIFPPFHFRSRSRRGEDSKDMAAPKTFQESIRRSSLSPPNPFAILSSFGAKGMLGGERKGRPRDGGKIAVVGHGLYLAISSHSPTKDMLGQRVRGLGARERPWTAIFFHNVISYPLPCSLSPTSHIPPLARHVFYLLGRVVGLVGGERMAMDRKTRD